jgi:hypothetical protein
MKRAFYLLFFVILSALPGFSAESTLWYRQPASNKRHIEEALPLGNGRMGCMISGGLARERIQFNELSLWSGDNNWDGAYECGDNGFGAYRNFGDLTITWNAGDTEPVVDSPSGHAQGDGKEIGLCVDGSADTKWCVADPGAHVVWQVAFPAARSVPAYTLTSADDAAAQPAPPIRGFILDL